MMDATNNKTTLSDIWLKAAVLGSLWAASEIIIGSFLHNLRVPLAGTILAAIGVAFLIGGHQLWPVRGLLWRAGLICAAMKSFSPSSVIIGPMIGIFMESVLLETSTRLLGRNFIGYIIGGALAVSWSLFQKITSLLITFGFNFVDLYTKLYQFAAKSLGVNAIGPLDLVVALFVIDLLFGATVAALAVTIGRQARLGQTPVATGQYHGAGTSWGMHLDPTQTFSLLFLLLNLVAIIFGLWLLNFYPLWMAALFVLIYAGLNLARYRRSLHRLKRPRLWISLTVIMMLSGLLLDGLRAENQFWSWKGMQIGLNMTTRAMLIILGFSAVSIELRNPRLLAWFTRRGLQEFSVALGVAFEALPEFTAAVSQQKHWWRHPAIMVPQLLRHAEAWLQNYRQKNSMPPPVIFLTGEAGQGKTTLAAEVAAKLQKMGLKVGGILAPGFWRNGKRQGFDLINIIEGKSVPLCRRDGADGAIAVGAFQFLSEGLRFGREALNSEALKKAEVIIVDEVGPLELRGEGWAPALDALVNEYHRPMLWVVRTSMIAQVAARWLKTAPLIRKLIDTDATRLAHELRQLASPQSLPSVSESENSSTPLPASITPNSS